ncbi:extracellular solute-binding protein [Paenibacillus sp. 598K]|uniref:extracellular solute-binding protein n=1 Tax=Paenibacillus sp. 598K TaxID=1117987 RepID=UPI000FFED542|nr:extracellular solute-binding protein [Paenibacillus sp. 598K]
MTKRKNMALALAMTMLLGTAAGCAGGNNTGNAGGGNAQGSQPPVTEGESGTGATTGTADGKYDPPIEVTAVRSVAASLKFENGDTISDNAWTRLYEDELGIKLKYLWVSDNTQYEQKLNVMMASGELPDIMPVPGVKMKQLYDAGLLADLSALLEQYGSEHTLDFLGRDGGNALDSATFGGKLVGLPLNPGSTDSAPLLWIREDWRTKLGLPEPRTMDDLLKIAEAFVSQDPDGNGKPDTVGLGVDKLLFAGLGGLEGFFNGYHAYPGIWVEQGDGSLAYGSVQPEMKTALAKLAELYKAGIIDREFGVKNTEQLIQDFNSGRLGIYYGQHYTPILLQDGKNNNPDLELKPYPLPSADDQPAKPQMAFSIPEYYVVSKDAKHPEAAIKLLNAYLEPRSREDYPVEEYSNNGDVEKWQYALLKGSNPTQNLDSYVNVKKALEANDRSILDETTPDPYVFDTLSSYYNGEVAGWGYTMVFGEGGAQSLLHDYNERNAFQPTAFNSAPTTAMSEQQATLSKLELETFTKIIMGEASVDAFDSFVESWKRLGGDLMTQEVAEWKASK